MTASPATPSHPDRRAIRSFSLVAIVVPLVLTMVAVVLQLVWLPTLPDPAAVHWGLSGGPDGYGPAWTFPVITLVMAAIPGLYPLWMVSEQIVFSLIMIGIADFLTSDHMRSTFAAPDVEPTAE